VDVVFRASSEVRGAILFASLVIALVFVPLLTLPGIEGRLLRPLGLAYVASLFGSLVVAVTVTPVLCLLLLPRGSLLDKGEGWLLRRLKSAYDRLLSRAVERPRTVFIAATARSLSTA